MAANTPTVKLNSGHQMPIIGLGTWKSEPGQVGAAVGTAIDCGYRHIDCAFVYGNEKEIGEVFHQKLTDGSVQREDLFVVSKLWNTFHRPGAVKSALMKSLEDLRLDYLDLYLMHWPVAQKESESLFERDEEEKVILADYDFVDTYKAMEELVHAGLVRSIGVSNFNKAQLSRLLQHCSIPPAVHQFEVHPFFNNKNIVDFTQKQGIAVTGYSPFASPDRPWRPATDPSVLTDEKIIGIADEIGSSPAETVLAWLIARGIIVIPKSVTPARIQQNLKAHEVKLSDEQMSVINGLHIGYRACPGGIWAHSQYYPFAKKG